MRRASHQASLTHSLAHTLAHDTIALPYPQVSNLTLGLPALWVDAGMPYEMAGKLFGGHAIHADGRWVRGVSFTYL